MKDRMPKSQLAQYAYGYSDEKPGRSFWLIIALMVAYIVYNLVSFI